jgi:hypothetical protein
LCDLTVEGDHADAWLAKISGVVMCREISWKLVGGSVGGSVGDLKNGTGSSITNILGTISTAVGGFQSLHNFGDWGILRRGSQ